MRFPDERTKPPTDSWENPVGEANTGLIGPDMGKSEKFTPGRDLEEKCWTLKLLEIKEHLNYTLNLLNFTFRSFADQTSLNFSSN